jgi:hypothetical protein
MKEPASKAELQEWVEQSRAAFVAQIEQTPVERVTEPGVEAAWSVKDIVAHITAWENTLCHWLPTAVCGEVPPVPQSDDDVNRMNHAFYEASLPLSWEAVWQAFVLSGPRVMQAVAEAPEADLFDELRFAWRDGRPLWFMVGSNTFWHYEEHQPQIAAWLKASS